MSSAPNTDTPLHRYIELDDVFYTLYENTQPDQDLIKQIGIRQPHAHVVVVSQPTCPDCARYVPRMARIAEHLPGWTWEIVEGSNLQRTASLDIIHTPTFILYNMEMNELGRITEHPLTGSLEQDLLNLLS